MQEGLTSNQTASLRLGRASERVSKWACIGRTQERPVPYTPEGYRIGLFVGDRDKREEQRWKQTSFD